MNSFLARLIKPKHGQASEKRMAKGVGGRQTPGSGALPGAKGDVVLPEFLMECKATVQQSMGLKQAWLKKISIEAQNAGKFPALSVSFTTVDGASQLHGDWVMVPLRVFNELMQRG